MTKQAKLETATFHNVTEIRIENDAEPGSTVVWIRLICNDAGQSTRYNFEGTRLSCFHPGDDVRPKVFVDDKEIEPNPIQPTEDEDEELEPHRV